jgi:hypothetical protein
MEGVEEYYKRVNQKQQLERDFHIVKGISYKEGAIPTMMIATANKDNWNDKDNKVKPKDLTNKKEAAKSPTKPEVASGNKHKSDPPASHSDDEAKSKNNAAATAPATKTEEKPAATSPTKPKVLILHSPLLFSLINFLLIELWGLGHQERIPQQQQEVRPLRREDSNYSTKEPA